MAVDPSPIVNTTFLERPYGGWVMDPSLGRLTSMVNFSHGKKVLDEKIYIYMTINFFTIFITVVMLCIVNNGK